MIMIMTLRYNIVRGSIFPSAVFFFTLIRMYLIINMCTELKWEILAWGS